ncbi:hypothetical protein [Pedobacter sp. GR22-10]|nr:hypothetical protein [Pedobacter sp. GR22-10]MCX2430892.1 hypothetical protein [Pedobacter sp. GR22-10]
MAVPWSIDEYVLIETDEQYVMGILEEADADLLSFDIHISQFYLHFL